MTILCYGLERLKTEIEKEEKRTESFPSFDDWDYGWDAAIRWINKQIENIEKGESK